MSEETITKQIQERARRWQEMTPEQRMRMIQNACDELFIHARVQRRRRLRELRKERA